MRRSLFISFLLTCIIAGLSSSVMKAHTDGQGMLESAYQTPGVADSFKVGGGWWPFPEYSDREAWEVMIPLKHREELIRRAEKVLNYRWQHIPASTFIALHTTGDKQQMRKIEGANRQAIIDLMAGELAEGKGRFLTQIADGIWFYATSHHWSHSNQTDGVLPKYESERIALGNIRLAATLPIVYHIFKKEIDQIEPLIGETFKKTVRRIILEPFLDESQDDQNWWLGFKEGVLVNNWNPWCNHGVILSFLLMEEDQDRLSIALAKSVRSVDRYLATYSKDGACEEGSTYWEQSVSRFCEYLQLLRDASGGKFEILPDEYIQTMGEYKSRVTIGRNPKSGKTLSINYGDGSMPGNMDVWMLWKVGRMLEVQELSNLGLFGCGCYDKQKFIVPSLHSDEGYRLMENIRACKDMADQVNALNHRIASGTAFDEILSMLRSDVPSVTWYESVQQAFVRTNDGLFIGTKAGNNGEPHGHNDVGNFIICVDDVPLIVDPGVGTYVKNTFGPKRYTIWTMQSPWHNCPMPSGAAQLNGANYSEGRKYAASDVSFSVRGGKATLKQELRDVYSHESGCLSWVRTLTVKEGKVNSVVVLEDEYQMSHRNGADIENFITPGTVKVEKNTALIENQGKTMKVEWSANLTASVEEKIMDDDKSRHSWGDKLYRLTLKSADDAPLKGKYKIIFTR